MSRRIWGALAVCVALAGTPIVFADHPQSDAPPDPHDARPWLPRVAPSASDLRKGRASSLERDLTRLIAALPEVEHVEVSVQLPAHDEQPLDQPPARASATVVVQTDGASSRRAEIERIVTTQLPTLQPADVTLVEAAIRPTSARETSGSLVQIGPFQVHPASAPGLRLGLGLLLATNAFLASVLLWRIRRSPSDTRKVDRDARLRFPP